MNSNGIVAERHMQMTPSPEHCSRSHAFNACHARARGKFYQEMLFVQSPVNGRSVASCVPDNSVDARIQGEIIMSRSNEQIRQTRCSRQARHPRIFAERSWLLSSVASWYVHA